MKISSFFSCFSGHSEPVNSHGGAGTKTKSSFGSHGKTPVAKSLFSFGSMKPGAKINPFTYGSKLIGYRLVMEEKNQNSDMFKVPKTIVEIPKNNEAKWRTAPEYQITNKIPIESARNILIMTSWRFGSTFLGDLLNHYPGVFYSFEPLHYLSRKVRIVHFESWNKIFGQFSTLSKRYKIRFLVHTNSIILKIISFSFIFILRLLMNILDLLKLKMH